MSNLRPVSKSFIVSYEDPDGVTRSNQVYAPDRDSAIWRLALLMQTPQAMISRIKFVSCDLEATPATVKP